MATEPTDRPRPSPPPPTPWFIAATTAIVIGYDFLALAWQRLEPSLGFLTISQTILAWSLVNPLLPAAFALGGGFMAGHWFVPADGSGWSLSKTMLIFAVLVPVGVALGRWLAPQ